MKLVNRSTWPTPALKVLCRWVAKREPGLPRQYEFLVRSTWDRYCGSGRGGRYGQSIKLGRRAGHYPLNITDQRFAWAPKQSVATRLEHLVFLLAHEAHHSTDGHPKEFRERGRVDRAGMEFHCNEAGMKAVRALHDEWPTIRTAIYRSMRRERDRLKAANRRRADRRSNPEPKLVYAREQMAVWQRKAKLAATKIRKYRRKVSYYEGKLAARKEQSA